MADGLVEEIPKVRVGIFGSPDDHEVGSRCDDCRKSDQLASDIGRINRADATANVEYQINVFEDCQTSLMPVPGTAGLCFVKGTRYL